MESRHGGNVSGSEDKRLNFVEVSSDLEMREIIHDGMKQLWTSGILSDITLVADGISFPAHRVILATASPFFMAMFTGGWTETSQSNMVELKGIAATGLQHLLHYIYMGELCFNPADVAEVLVAADQLQVLPAVRFCAQFMEKYIDVDNCVDVLNIAQMYSLENLEYSAVDFIKKNFQGILKCKHHCRLKLSDFLYFIDGEHEGEDIVEIDTEMSALSAAVEWLRFDQGKRIAYVEQVMEAVRFPLLSPDELEGFVTNFPCVPTHPGCQNLVDDAHAYHNKPIHHRMTVQSKNTKVRNRESLILLSSLHPDNMEAFVLSPHHTACEDPHRTKWMSVPVFPPFNFQLGGGFEQCYTLEMNGFLIVLVVQPTANTDYQLTAFTFDPRLLKWFELASYEVAEGQQTEAAVACQDELFVFLKEKDDQAKEILKYSFMTNSWEHHGYMRPKFLKYSVCNCQENIYIFGIKAPNSPLACYLYNQKKQSWVEKSLGTNFLSLENSKSFVYGRQILHCGVEEDVLSFDMYRPDDDTWNTLWINEGFSDLTVDSLQVMAGENLFFLHDMETKPYTIEMTLGNKFRHMGMKFIRHEQLPFSIGKGSLVFSLRMPRSIHMVQQ